MESKLGWGILGTGGIAKVFAESLAFSSTGKLVAVGSRSKESANQFAEQYKIPKRFDYDGVLADPEVQAVYISFPNDMHAEWAIKCAAAKKHILLEKPLALNYAEAMQVIEAARYHGVFLMEAFMYRCHPQTAKIAQLVREKAIGETRVIQCNFAYNMGQKLDNIRLKNSAGGGAIMDVGCYTMSMARLVAGAAQGKHEVAEPVEIKGFGQIGSASRVDEWAVAAVKFPGGVLANLACGSQVGIGASLTVYGSSGNIVVTNPWFPGRNKGDVATIIVNRDGQKPEEVQIKAEDPLYTIEADIVARHAKDKQPPYPCMTWSDSIGNQRALDTWRQQAGLSFDTERTQGVVKPLSGKPLSRRPDHKMKYGKVEGIDKPVARVVMGSMVINTNNLPYSFTLLDNYYEIGGNTIDTAYVYGGGLSERAVGQWVKSRGVRDEMVIIAKGAATASCTPDMVTRELLESIYRFGLDHADLYMMHRDNPNVPVGEFIGVLNEHKNAGRIKAFGGSNWKPERLQEANEYAKANGLTGMSASSPNFSLAEWNEPMWGDCVTASDRASRAWYEKTQLPLFAWSSQASGLFTGRFSPNDRSNRDVARVWFNEGNFERMKRVEELAKKKGLSTTQIALAYVLSQPLNIYALIGPQSLEETRSSADALGTTLTPDEVKWLNLEA